jgi:chloramphenicol-sensitive protein RarD
MLHRLLWSFFLLLGYMLLAGKLTASLKILRRPGIAWALLASSLIISCNWLIFIWATNNNEILATSLGYFLSPIFNMVCGLLLFKDRLNRTQWLAVILAVFGVGAELFIVGRLPWIALALPLLFTAYGVVRKTVAVGATVGLFIETMFMAPLALMILVWMGVNGELAFGVSGLKTNLLLALGGLVTTVPLVMFTHGARNLKLTTLGLIQYLSPISSMFLGIFVYGEEVSPAMLLSFIFIWAGLCIYTWGSLRQHYRWWEKKDKA